MKHTITLAALLSGVCWCASCGSDARSDSEWADRDYCDELLVLVRGGQGEGENAWPHIERATGIYVQVYDTFTQDVPPSLDILVRPNPDPKQETAAWRMIDSLAEQGALDALSRAADCPNMVRPQPDRLPRFVYLPRYGREVRYLCLAKLALLQRDLQRGDESAIADGARRLLQIAAHLSHQPSITEWINTTPIVAVLSQWIGQAAMERQLAPATCRQLINELQSHGYAPPRKAVVAEGIQVLEYFDAIYTYDGEPADRLNVSAMKRAGKAADGPTADGEDDIDTDGRFASRREAIDKASAFFDHAVEFATLSPRDRMRLEDPEIIEKLEKNSAKAARHLPLLQLAPNVWRLVNAADRTEAFRRGAITMLALEIYRDDHGEYPDRLDRLVPGILDGVLNDPYDDSPLKYRRKGDRYVLYACDIGGRDDGGLYDRREQPLGVSGVDVVFTLTRDEIEQRREQHERR